MKNLYKQIYQYYPVHKFNLALDWDNTSSDYNQLRKILNDPCAANPGHYNMYMYNTCNIECIKSKNLKC